MIIVLPTKALDDLNNMNEEFNYIRRNVFEEMCCLHEFHFKIFRSRQISWSICLYKQNLSYHELCAMGLPNIVAIQSNVLNSVSDDVFVLCDK